METAQLERLGAIWTSLDTPRRGLAILAVAAFLAVTIGFVNLVSRPDMALLYGNMDPGESARVLMALDQRNVRYEVRGQSIFVESPRRDTLRMELAGEGLPAASGAGYELLDTLSGFGTTSQMFDAAYWRAKEGELARTITASPMIREARVHIATAGSSVFQRDSKTTASVAIVGNRTITRDSALAIQSLVASAVPDLMPEDVSVIDSQTGRVIAPTDEIDSAGHAEDREQALQARVLRMLEARVGPGNARVEINIERELRSETLTERHINPESRVIISQDSEEISSQSSNGGGDAVTVASNLPSGDAAASNAGSSEQTTETRERANFDVSETRREMVMAPGAIKRLSVAVLVNSMAPGDNGSAADQTRTEAELADLRELVSAAVGLNAERGDVLTLKALDFTAAPALGTAPAVGMFERAGLNVWQLIQLGVMAVVTLVLGLFVIRPLLLSQGGAAPALGEPSGLPVITGTASEESLPELDGGAGETGGLPALEGGLPALSVVSDFDMDGDPMGDAENPIQRLKQAIETRQPDTLEILRGWMDPGINETEEA